MPPADSQRDDRIAFETERDRNSEIHVMNTDGTDQIRLTFAPSLGSPPLWSAGDSRLVFSKTEGDSIGDGLTDLPGMATLFCVDPESRAAQSCWRRRTIFGQMVP